MILKYACLFVFILPEYKLLGDEINISYQHGSEVIQRFRILKFGLISLILIFL